MDKFWADIFKVGRPGWDTYFMDIVHMVARRANCIRRQVGAVIVAEKRIISTGYNGTARGIKNCNEGGCKRCNSPNPAAVGSDTDTCICSHAEENAIAQAALYGTALRGSTIYVTISPCLSCAKMIIGAGIKHVVFENHYSADRQAHNLLKRAGVRCRKFERK